MLDYLKSTFEVLVGKMHYNWKILCLLQAKNSCKTELNHSGQFVAYRQFY